MLTYLIRGERFHEGLLAEAVENDVIAEILQRLDELKAGWLCRNKAAETGASSS